MSFCWSTLYVKDMEESVKFYEEVIGLGVQQRFSAGPNMEIAFLGEGETKIELIWDQSKKEVNTGTDISWGFRVDSLKETMEFLMEKGVPIIAGPIEPNPTIKFIYILDPNGMKIQLFEQNLEE